MKDNTKIILVAALALICLSLGIMIGYSLAPTKTVTQTKTEYYEVPTLKIDTLKYSYTKIRKDTVHNYDTTLIVRCETDTLFYKAPAFSAQFDTTTANGRVRLEYLYPENMLRNLLVEPKQIKIYQIQTVAEKRPLWIDILTHTGAAAVGFGVGYLVGAK